ncbi:MAG: hypothetical protein P9L99_15905 [Candidatus Lernaella stagnicola]|nr:hypothetical protein [Candidatus Lernaella stagnicola]
MTEWWEALSLFQKVLWVIAVPSSLLTLLQVVLELVGIGGETDTDADMSGLDGIDAADFDVDSDTDAADHGSGIRIFSVKGLIIFFTAFAWIGLAGVNAGLVAFVASLIATVSGFAFMLLFAWIFYTLNKLSEEGTVRTRNALFQTGEVYLRIPAERSGYGKVTVIIQGHLRELNAYTDGEELPTGARIQVVDIIDQDMVLVVKET